MVMPLYERQFCYLLISWLGFLRLNLLQLQRLVVIESPLHPHQMCLRLLVGHLQEVMGTGTGSSEINKLP